jgi:hypothetical protein
MSARGDPTESPPYVRFAPKATDFDAQSGRRASNSIDGGTPPQDEMTGARLLDFDLDQTGWTTPACWSI